MAWGGAGSSRIFRQFVADVFQNTIAADFDTDVPKVALFNNSVTPAGDAGATATAYANAAGTWVVANEVIDTSGNANWVAGGRVLTGITLHFTDTANTIWYDAADTAGAGNMTVANVYGCLVYDDTLATPVADQGICFNYLGGAQGVTGGTFAVVWHVNGIWRIGLP
jgi:hypothetical protein